MLIELLPGVIVGGGQGSRIEHHSHVLWMHLSVGGVLWELRLSSNGRFYRHSLSHSSDPPPVPVGEIGFDDVIPRLLEELLSCSHTHSDIYTGHAGVSLTLHLLSKHDSALVDQTTCAVHLGKIQISDFGPREYTFMCGTGGYYALRAAFSPSDSTAIESLQRIGHERVLTSPRENCELLYGRVGFLQCLLFARRALNSSELFSDLIIALVLQIIDEGRRRGFGDHLMWSWHGKSYLGAAHGVAGIVYTLLCCSRSELTQLGRISLLPTLEATVYFILANNSTIRSVSRNIASSTDSNSDKLVHFCHGATGWVPVLLKMWLVTGKEEYRSVAIQCGNTIWERGLLVTKGPGICHGIGGSICAMVDLFTATRQSLWLERSKYFSLALVTFLDELSSHADRPHSLMEGRAGALYSLGLVSLLVSGKYHCPMPPTEEWTSCFPGL